MVESMVEVRRQTAQTADYLLPDEAGVDQMISEILDKHGGAGEGERAVAQVRDHPLRMSAKFCPPLTQYGRPL